jgi:membrane protease YdiL (CAAX protease family)
MTTFKTKILPIFTILLIFLFWNSSFSISFLVMIVPMLLILLISYIEHNSSFLKRLGFSRNQLTVKNIFLTAPMTALGLFLTYYYLLVPLATFITNTPIDYSDFDVIKGNPTSLVILILFAWVSAAFGEEVVWRGYFMKQFIKFFGEGKISLLLNIIILGILFGWLHSYQGITGQIASGLLGMILSTIFYFKKYDLWFNIAVHGYIDTIAFVALYISLGS